jgi:hypothetical protein
MYLFNFLIRTCIGRSEQSSQRNLKLNAQFLTFFYLQMIRVLHIYSCTNSALIKQKLGFKTCESTFEGGFGERSQRWFPMSREDLQRRIWSVFSDQKCTISNRSRIDRKFICASFSTLDLCCACCCTTPSATVPSVSESAVPTKAADS